MRKLYDRIVFDVDDLGDVAVLDEPEVVVEEVVEESSIESQMDDLFEEYTPDLPESPEVEEVEEEVEVKEVPEVKEVVEPAANTELEELKAANAKLLEQVNNLSTPLEVEDAKKEDVDIKDLSELFKDDDITELFDTKEGFLGFMQKVANHVRETTLNQFNQLAPNLVSNTIQSQNSLKEVRDAFYADNSDLVPVGKYVSKVASGISEANPDWTVDQVLKQAALDTRAALNIKVPVKEVGKVSRKPALPGATSKGKGKPAPTNSLTDEMEDLFSDY